MGGLGSEIEFGSSGPNINGSGRNWIQHTILHVILQQSYICHPTELTMPEDAVIEREAVVTFALAVRRSAQ